jgi:hypothetical protein
MAATGGGASMSGMGDVPVPDVSTAVGHHHGQPMSGTQAVPSVVAPAPRAKLAIVGGFVAINFTVLLSAALLKRLNARLAAIECVEREAARRG